MHQRGISGIVAFYSVSSDFGKTGESSNVPGWCREGHSGYAKIEDYVKREAKAFISAYMIFKREMPKLEASLLALMNGHNKPTV